MYGAKRAVLVAFGLYLAGEIAFMGYFISHTTLLPDPPGVAGCAGGGVFGNRGAAAFWAPSLIFDLVVFTMTMYKSYKTYQGSRSLGVLGILLRDGSLYFAVVFSINLMNMLTLLLAPLDLVSLHANLSTSVPVVITSRLILNLRSSRAASTETATYPSASRNLSRMQTMSFGTNTAVQSIASKWGLGGILDVLGDSKFETETSTGVTTEYELDAPSPRKFNASFAP